jgi:hypothetical protein
VVAHDKAGGLFLNRPGRREAGEGALLAGIHFLKAEGFYDGCVHGFFPAQNLIEMGSINAVTLRKCVLCSSALNCRA